MVAGLARGAKAQSGGGYDSCWKRWKVRDAAKSTNHSSANAQGDAGAEDATKAKLKRLRGRLADLRRQAENPDLATHVQGTITTIQEEVDELQAAADAGSDAPRCFSENKTQGQRGRTEERAEKQGQKIKEAQEKLDKEQALLARQGDKLQKQNARIEELSMPKAGQGWVAAVSFLEQATKFLRDQGADPKLSEALRYAKQEQAAKKEADAAREAAKDAKDKGAGEQQVIKIMQDAGCAREQIERRAEGGQGFIAVSANSIGTLERAMRSIRYTNKFPVIMAQELQANEHGIACFTQRMQKEGWRLGISPSVRAASGGWSEGVLLATGRPNDMCYARGLDTWGISPRESNGRFAIGWVDALGKQGVAIGAAYLWVSEGMTDRNKAILRNFTTAAMAVGKYWILGGGFNMDPAGLQQTGVVDRKEGIIAFDTSRGSCVCLGEARRRDYFISKTLLDGPPHLAVQDQHSQGEVGSYWSNLANTYEEHLNEHFNYVGLEWHDRKGHLQAPTCAWGQLKLSKVCEAGREQQWAEAAEWLGRRLELISTAVRAWRRNGKQETLCRAQCNANGILEKDIIEPRLERRHPAWSDEPDQERAADGRENGGDIGDHVDVDAERENDSVGAEDCLSVGAEAAGERRLPTGRGHWTDIDWSKLANAIAWIGAANITERGLHRVDCAAKLTTVASQRMWRRVQREAARGRRRWVAKHSQAGAGALRKWTKPPVPWGPIKPTEHHNQQELTHPQVAADAALEGWETVWADSHDASELRCQPPSDDEWREHAVPRITPRDIIEAATLFYLKPKAAGGFRNLGLVPELARVWGTTRIPCARRWEYAVTYFDLVKCFERATHRKVWEATRSWGFNPVIVRTVFKIYGTVGRAVLGGCCAEGRFPRADTCLFFGDLAMATRGIREFVDHFHPLPVAAVVYMFAAELDMALSRGAEGKTVTLTSSAALGQNINANARRLGVRVVKHEKHLGEGRRRCRQAKVPALLYGSTIVGTADSKLNELRKSAATAMEGNTKGRSTALKDRVDRADPGNLVNSGPIIAWATAWQEALEDAQLAERLHSAWRTSVMKIYKCRAPWLTARGPAGAFAATVKRFGWMTQAAHSVTIDGAALDLRFAKLRVVRTAELQLKGEWVKQCGHQYGITSIFLEWHLTARAGRAGWHLAPIDIELSRAPRASGAEAWSGAHAFNSEEQTHGLAQGLKEIGGGGGIMADPAVELRLWDLASCDDWLAEGNWGGLATGDIYVDGSLQFGDCPALRRGGWSFTKLKGNDEYEMDCVCYGPLPGTQWIQSVPRAELYALLQALTVGTPPIIIHTDCQNVVDGAQAGPTWLGKRSRPHLDIWERIFEAIAEHGGLSPRAVMDHCILIGRGRTALRREPYDLPSGCLVFVQQPARPSGDGSLRFSLLVDDVTPKFDGLPLMGFTRREPLDAIECYPCQAQCLAQSVSIGRNGEAFARDQSTHLTMGFKQPPLEELMSWCMDSDKPPHLRRAPCRPAPGDTLEVVWGVDGTLSMLHDGTVVLSFDTGRRPDRRAHYYGFVDVCLSVSQVTLLPSERCPTGSPTATSSEAHTASQNLYQELAYVVVTSPTSASVLDMFTSPYGILINVAVIPAPTYAQQHTKLNYAIKIAIALPHCLEGWKV
ncbi:unnamed protein product [Prorocentrum cordatum]|uniref:Uncharacterized protein n=1 Tax=Prorocentrum cordatum TaxID=2364126 RepID=A0ABN9UEW8_9DINO|nr:unnamed protein product [Polarella glacialis]